MQYLPLVLGILSLLLSIGVSIVVGLLGYIVRQKDAQIIELRAKVGKTFDALDAHRDVDQGAHTNLRERIHAVELALTKLDLLDGMQASVDRLAKEVSLLREEFVRLKAAGPGRYSSKPSSSSLPAASDPPKR